MKKSFFRTSALLFVALALMVTWNVPAFSGISAEDSGQIMLAKGAAQQKAPKAKPAVDNPTKKGPVDAPKPGVGFDNPTKKGPVDVPK